MSETEPIMSFQSLIRGTVPPLTGWSKKANSVCSNQAETSMTASLIVTSPIALAVSSLSSSIFSITVSRRSKTCWKVKISSFMSFGIFKIPKRIFQWSRSNGSPVIAFSPGKAELNRCTCCARTCVTLSRRTSFSFDNHSEVISWILNKCGLNSSHVCFSIASKAVANSSNNPQDCCWLLRSSSTASMSFRFGGSSSKSRQSDPSVSICSFKPCHSVCQFCMLAALAFASSKEQLSAVFGFKDCHREANFSISAFIFCMR
mmetsp:Transcript_77593/g.142621  ORF Transcript_77593/g.142621 Transcript_77593/m.142621 type:complete len:260 (-) Transcript_77593:98-877(-)